MIRVLDSTLKIISTITRYTSVEFEKNFNDYGTFTVQLPKASGNTNLKVTDGDKTVKEWKSILVEEDPIYCSERRADVEDFINLIK